MTLFAGIFTRNPEVSIPDSMSETLRASISRNQDDSVKEYRNTRVFIVSVDIGAYGESGFRISSEGSVALLAGEPLLTLNASNSWRTRTEDLEALHQSWDAGDWTLLRAATGVFSALYYSPTQQRLCLISDKLCIRPLYYWISDQFVVFASALRILTSLDEVPRVMDVRAVTEIVSLGLPLGTRTGYAHVGLMRAAEILEISDGEICRRQYWRWDDIRQSQQPEGELLKQVHESFTRAVARRARADKSTVSFLSGGLDSRCIVATLREQQNEVHTFNFARTGTQDQVLGSEFAKRAHTIHEEVAIKTYASPRWSLIMSDAWNASRQRSVSPAARPNLIWSGDGGSVGFGHVYVSRKIVKLMRAGQKDQAIEEFLVQQGAHIPAKLLKQNVGAALSNSLRDDIKEELDDIHTDDPGRGFYIFLLLNDQRRHLALHFEDIDLHRLEFQLPFYDSDLLATIVSTPIDLCLDHKLYAKWLNCLPPVVTSVPWQTYPGHEPCPLPIPEELSYQWDAKLTKARRNELLTQATQILRARDFPRGILNRYYLTMTTLLYRLGVRDFGYLIHAASVYHQYWTQCGGKYAMNV